jgi:large subunit ribosomal protein L4
MTSIPIYNWSGEKLKEKEAPSVFKTELNIPLLHQVVRNYLNGQRQGTACAKSRGEVRGGGAKPWRQKGTGRARAGSNRSPLWRTGGVIFGPKPRDYSFSMPKKMKVEAFREAVAEKIKEKGLFIINEEDVSVTKTKEVFSLLKKMGINESCLFVFSSFDKNAERFFRNISFLQVKNLNNVNTYEILKHKNLLTTEKTFADWEGRLTRKAV